MIKAFFGLSAFAFKKDTGEIFVSRQMGYLQKRGAHFLETQGMALLTGEIGSGKTTFVRWFLNSLDRHSYQHFYLSQTVRHSRSFFRSLAACLGLVPRYYLEDVTAQVKTEIAAIYHKRKLLPVLVFDEAQNLSDTVLEEIRLLTNFGMDERHCLAVFLLGHPVLKARLKLAPYAALKQRIAFQYHLTGLEQDEIGPYIAYRLKLAGRTRPIFSDEAVTLLFNYSKGLPRMINTLAHEALYRAALEEKTLVDEKTIENIVQEWDSL